MNCMVSGTQAKSGIAVKTDSGYLVILLLIYTHSILFHGKLMVNTLLSGLL